MIAELNNLDRIVSETADEFPGEVVGIRYTVSDDWNGDPAIFFRVLLSDNASRAEVLADVTRRVGSRVADILHLDDSDYTPYFYFRSKSEQDKLTDPEWQSLTTS